MARIDGQRLLADLRALAQFGKAGTGVNRVSFSSADLEARAWLRSRMEAAGLDAAIDAVGNVRGVTAQAPRAVVIGSHTDTVPMGGWLDGAMGVLYGLEIARARIASGRHTALGVDVVSFQDEEGTYLPCLGSRSFCGDLPPAELERPKSQSGEPLPQALARAGYGGAPWRLDRQRHIAYLEAHIEQGPRLEAAGRRIGVVTGIVGIRRFRVSARGQADHAGTTPMSMRQDAARPLFAFAARVHAELPPMAGPDTVWNIGVVSVRPGAANVVPSEAELVVEFRDTSSELLDRIEARLLAWVRELDGEGRVRVEAQPIARIAPTLMAEPLEALIEASAGEHGQAALRMPSGAGHDAMVLGRYVPSAMLFIPSIGGRSHDIAEDTAEDDIVLGCEVLAGVVERLEDGARTAP
ncbi:MAG TPA: M20 family metallo-hydrolase [Burkholderiales bacterium]|nr:M20 family metallo-hydrolase [Burkholderiales bacterium]